MSRKIIIWILVLIALVSSVSAVDYTGSPYNNGNLLALYPMNETTGTTTYDAENSYDGTITGATINQDGKEGKCYSFDGNDKVTFSDPIITSGNFSISAWIKTTMTSSGAIVSQFDYDGSNKGFEFGINRASGGGATSGRLHGFVGVTTTFTSMVATDINNGSWHHVVMLFNSVNESVGLYYNGDLLGWGSDYVSTLTMDSGNNMGIGYRTYLTGDTFFDGDIDEVNIYNELLTPTEIEQLYNLSGGGSPTNSSYEIFDIEKATYVTDFGQNNNYGSSSSIEARSDSTDAKIIYLEVDLTGYPHIINSELYLHTTSVDNDASYNLSVYKCDDTFTETTITWNNRDTEVTDCETTPITTANLDDIVDEEYLKLNITNAGNGVYTLKIQVEPLYSGSNIKTIFDSDDASSDTPYINFTYSNLSVEIESPKNNYQANTTTLDINFTVNSETLANCSLYINGSLNETQNNLNGSYQYNLINLVNGEYSYYITCDNDATSLTTDEQTFYIDQYSPTITPLMVGAYWSYNITYNINATDTFLYNISLVDSCGNSYTNSSITNPHTVDLVYNIASCDYGSQQTNITVCDAPNGTVLHCISEVYDWTKKSTLLIGVNLYDESVIQNYSVYLNGSLHGLTTGQYYYMENLSYEDIAVSVYPHNAEYQIKVVNITINETLQYYNFTLYHSNSLLIHIYNENDFSLIDSDDINLTYYYDNIGTINTTSNGTIYLKDLDAGAYILKFTSEAGYSDRYYYLTLSDRDSMELNAYLLPDYYSTLRNFVGYCEGSVEDDILLTFQKNYNNSYYTIAQRYTDDTGWAGVYLNPDTEYRGVFYKEDVGTFTLDFTPYNDPISFEICTGTGSQPYNWSNLFDKFDYIISPTNKYLNDSNTTFSFTLSSPDGYISSFGIKYNDSIYDTITGSPSGGTVSLIWDISDLVNIELYYWVNVSGEEELYELYSYYYYTNYTAGNTSFTSVVSDIKDESDANGLNPYWYYIIVTIISFIAMAGVHRFVRPYITAIMGLGVFIIASAPPLSLINWLYVVPMGAIIIGYALFMSRYS